MSDTPPDLSRLAHEMSNSLAYVTTNLNVLSEELPSGEERAHALVADALEGAQRLGALVRQLRQSGWTPPPPSVGAGLEANILVVDDEPGILTAVKRALRRHKVTISASAEQAEHAMKEASFDVILCDLVMPDRTGIELFEHVEVYNPAVAERFIFMTGGGFTDRTRAFLANTQHPVLHKPFDAKTLRWVVSTRLEEHA